MTSPEQTNVQKASGWQEALQGCERVVGAEGRTVHSLRYKGSSHETKKGRRGGLRDRRPESALSSRKPTSGARTST